MIEVAQANQLQAARAELEVVVGVNVVIKAVELRSVAAVPRIAIDRKTILDDGRRRPVGGVAQGEIPDLPM